MRKLLGASLALALLLLAGGSSPLIQSASAGVAVGNRCRDARGRFIKCPPPPPTPVPAPIPPPPPPPVVSWVFCALQGNSCTVNGTANVRYGDPDLGLWTPSKRVTGSIFCDSSVFGDPKPGDSDKSCQTDGTVAAPAPTPVPTPTPTPVPAPTGSWVQAPLTVGGYACSKVQAADPKSGPCGKGIVYKVLSVGQSSDTPQIPLYALQFYSDASGNFPVNDPYDTSFIGYWQASDLQGLAPAQ